MTVAQLRDRGEGPVDVAFFESARFYTLSRDHPGFEDALALLRDAMKGKRPLVIGLASEASGEIVGVGESD
jgi:hypothetical protein